ncbi:ubiquitin-conjugating enzyme H [Escherichia phage vB_EcoM-720R8]|nr:ubiquitin-conjugating enzyme H [Escherichia phage vB_EcoM-720R8]
MYELWWELTYLWHRVKPNLTVRSVLGADIVAIYLHKSVGSCSLVGNESSTVCVYKHNPLDSLLLSTKILSSENAQ